MSGMDLQNFVADSISQICHGIVDAQKKVENLGAIVSPRATFDKEGRIVLVPDENSLYSPFLLKFDVALTVGSASDTNDAGSKKAAIKVAAATFGFEHSDGSALSKTSTQSVISHVSFDIPVIWPMHDASKFLEDTDLAIMVSESKWPKGAV